jgi:two-component system chemotaxis sensor kinase CheA
MSQQEDLDHEIVQEFLIESHENLDQLDQDLVALEQQPDSHALLASIFRTIHTIKGTSGFLAFHRLESLTHAGESLLARLRDGVATMTPMTADVLLRMVDVVRALLASIEADGAEGEIDVEPLVAEIRAAMDEPAAAVPASPVDVPASEPSGEVAAVDAAAIVETAAVDESPVEVVADATAPVDATDTDVSTAQVAGEPAAWARPSSNGALAETSIRVDVELLEQLVRLAGELVLARNQIVRRAQSMGDEDLARACHRLNLVASELQEGVMRTRMQPIDHIWSKLPRVVRDLGAQLGRSVRLEMEGGDTGLDRTLLEAVKDPLTHLVRNAIDHGIEPPEVRTAAGKPTTGVLRLRAAHEGGQVLVEVSDDGKGIDPAVIAAKALSQGLITISQRDTMSTAEILRLVFIPGFSTASKVTNVSGRGVGMDVVKTNIERIGGSIDVESTPGHGAIWRLRIPLTLAIVPALTVLCRDQRYAIPQVNLLELVSLDSQRAVTALEDVGGAQVYRLRGSLLPVVSLAEVLDLAPNAQQEQIVIAVLESDGRRFGLIVDRVLDTEEIVVKPLSGALKEVGLYAGATILGDGRVSLILDVQSLARRSIRAADATDPAANKLSNLAAAVPEERKLLLVSVGEDRQVAIPLDVVTRLETFDVNTIERVGHREVVRYRERVLPLVRLGSHLGSYDTENGEGAPLHGVVYTARGRSVALVVNEIVDIVADDNSARSDIDDVGLVGSAVLRDRVTELLDVRAAILAADPMFFASGEGLEGEYVESEHHIDSPYDHDQLYSGAHR